jgi:regulator of replication initiation timing
MAKTAVRGTDTDSLDRLEDKIKRLVVMVEKMRADEKRAADENQRLRAEVDALKARAASGETLSSELSALKDERDVIRTRVGDMLHQLEALNL